MNHRKTFAATLSILAGACWVGVLAAFSIVRPAAADSAGSSVVVAAVSPGDECSGCVYSEAEGGPEQDDIDFDVCPNPKPEEGEEHGDGECTDGVGGCDEESCHVNGSVMVTNNWTGAVTVKWDSDTGGGVTVNPGGQGTYNMGVREVKCRDDVAYTERLPARDQGGHMAAYLDFQCTKCE